MDRSTERLDGIERMDKEVNQVQGKLPFLFLNLLEIQGLSISSLTNPKNVEQKPSPVDGHNSSK
jgi:hypothetical protein